MRAVGPRLEEPPSVEKSLPGGNLHREHGEIAIAVFNAYLYPDLTPLQRLRGGCGISPPGGEAGRLPPRRRRRGGVFIDLRRGNESPGLRWVNEFLDMSEGSSMIPVSLALGSESDVAYWREAQRKVRAHLRAARASSLTRREGIQVRLTWGSRGEIARERVNPTLSEQLRGFSSKGRESATTADDFAPLESVDVFFMDSVLALSSSHANEAGVSGDEKADGSDETLKGMEKAATQASSLTAPSPFPGKKTEASVEEITFTIFASGKVHYTGVSIEAMNEVINLVIIPFLLFNAHF
ncbi:unnamed protein product [Phytomonas sp. EM1]|nr:unnamed protein product [Phytomonas sp. EM1]|eukprot:CCW61082.1 unnamed protein product [Phytomonas sp. isolate EM1]